MDAAETGRNLMKLRKERKLSQERLAELSGISRIYISKIERGEAENVSMKVLESLTKAMGVNIIDVTNSENLHSVNIPNELSAFAKDNMLPYPQVEALSNIPLKDETPRTYAEWQELYNAIRQFM